MDSLFFANTLLLTGQSAPFTGEWINMAKTRETLYSAYSLGTGAVSLEYQSPFFPTDGIQFYSLPISGGYSTPAFSTSPMAKVRAISSGNGAFYCAMTSQN